MDRMLHTVQRKNVRPVGYKPIRSWLACRTNPGIVRAGGQLLLCGKAVCDVASDGHLCLEKDLVIGGNLRFGSQAESYLKIHQKGVLTVKGRFQIFFGGSVEIFPGASLTLGRGYINTGAAISCGKQITLGDEVFIARNVYITDSDHHRIFDTKGTFSNEPADVIIGDHVWIGYGAIILKGVSVGDGAIIAAGSVVTHNVPSNCLAAGVPAKVIRKAVNWE